MFKLKLFAVLWWIIQRYILGHPILFTRHVAREQKRLSEFPLPVTYKGYWFSLMRIYRYVIEPANQPILLPDVLPIIQPPKPHKMYIIATAVGTFFHLKDEHSRSINYTGRIFHPGEVIGSMLILRLTFPLELTAVWEGAEIEPHHYKYTELTEFDAIRICQVFTANGQIVEWGQKLFEIELVQIDPVPAQS